MCKGAKSVIDKKKTKLSGVELYFEWPVSEPEWHKGRQLKEQSRGGPSSQSGDEQVDQSRGEQAQTQGGEQSQSVLYVYGIPAGMHDDIIRNYFSNKRNGGGPIDKMDKSDLITCIHFKQAQGVHIF
jgi:hypothetical protein